MVFSKEFILALLVLPFAIKFCDWLGDVVAHWFVNRKVK